MTRARATKPRAFRLGPLVTLMVVLLTMPVAGQERRPGRDLGFDPAPWQAFNTEYSGQFTFVRLMVGSFRGGRGFRRNPPWAHDYPTAETNFGKILSELTSMQPFLGGGNVLAMDDPELFRYPIAYLSEPGYWIMSEAEASNLRQYLLKGGFLILDDFAGPQQWYNTLQALEQLLPEHRVIQLDETHPVFDSFFRIEQIEMPHPNYGVIASYYAMFENNDPDDRMMIMINRDNDIGDYWEWSDRGFVPIELSNEAYKLGVNYVVYALTH